jgi:hypothetical protein
MSVCRSRQDLTFQYPCSRSGGNLKEGGKNGTLGSPHAVGGTCLAGHGNRAPT